MRPAAQRLLSCLVASTGSRDARVLDANVEFARALLALWGSTITLPGEQGAFAPPSFLPLLCFVLRCASTCRCRLHRWFRTLPLAPLRCVCAALLRSVAAHMFGKTLEV